SGGGSPAVITSTAAGPLFFTDDSGHRIGEITFPSQTVISVTGIHVVVPFAGQSVTTAFATFTTTTPGAKASDFHATINFGDRTSGPGTIVADPSVPGRFDVLGTHTYSAAEVLPTSIVVTDQEGNVGHGFGVVTVAAMISVTGLTVGSTAGQPVTATFADFL